MSEGKKMENIFTGKNCPFSNMASGLNKPCKKNCPLYIEAKLLYEDGTVKEESKGCAFAVIAEIKVQESWGL